MKSTQTSALTVRFTPEMRAKLEAVAENEHRPAANQVVHFVAIGIEEYLRRYNAQFVKNSDGTFSLDTPYN